MDADVCCEKLFSQKFHKASTWFVMWLSIAVLGVVFGGTGISGTERAGLTSPEVLQRMASMLITMLPAIYGGMIFGYREKKKGFARLMAIFAGDLILGFLIGGGICMTLLVPAHMALLTTGIKRTGMGKKEETFGKDVDSFRHFVSHGDFGICSSIQIQAAMEG